MKPGLLPMMLLRDSYEVAYFLEPVFPVGKSISILGVAGSSTTVIGPAGKSLITVGPDGLSVEVP